MLTAILLGFIGGMAFTLINLNPGFRFTKLGVSTADLLWATGVNAFLGGVAGLLGWSFASAGVQPPKSYGIYVLCGVGGGSLIQSWSLAFANMHSKEMLNRAVETVETLSRVQSSPQSQHLGELSRSLRSSTDRRQQERLSHEMFELASKIASDLR